MAVITKIRNRSGLLIGVIGMAMVLFILGDLLNNNQGLLSGQETDVAVIGGEPISFREFETRVEQEIAQQYPNTPVNENIRRSVRNRLWNQLLQEKILFKEYDPATANAWLMPSNIEAIIILLQLL